jgi:hypothetical protein
LTNPTAFNVSVTGITSVGFNGILPAGTPFEAFNPLTVSGINFSTSNPATNVNVTTSTFYTPNNYPADFIIDSSNPGPNNQVTITLPKPTRALGMDYGGFTGGSSGSISLSNGFVLPLSGLPAAGQTQFSGFVSATPFSSLTFNVTNDSWVVLDLLQGTADTALPSTTEGTPYTEILLEQGGVGALTWSLAGGALPPGTNLTAAGTLMGTPTAGGAYSFTVNVVDSSNPQKSATSGRLTLNVAPTPPTNAAPGTITSGQATIIWEFSSSGDVTGYNVYRSTTSGGPYALVGSVPPSAFSFSDPTVASGTTYYYVVRAAVSSVESVNSDEVTAVVP